MTSWKPPGHCWWERYYYPSVGRGGPRTISSYGCVNLYSSVVPWCEEMCEHRPWSTAALGKAVPCLQPRLLLGKPLMNEVGLLAELWGAPKNTFTTCNPLLPSHMGNSGGSLCSATIIYPHGPLGTTCLMPSSEFAIRSLEDTWSLDHGNSLTLHLL